MKIRAAQGGGGVGCRISALYRCLAGSFLCCFGLLGVAERLINLMPNVALVQPPCLSMNSGQNIEIVRC